MTTVWKVPFPTSTQMVIALKLADHAKDDGADIFPGRSSLAARARCSESTVKTTLKLLREAGILIVVEEGGTKGPHHTTRYQMNVPLLEAIAKGDLDLSGSSDSLKIEWSEDSGKRGSKFDPLEFYPGSRLSTPGQPAVATRVASPPQTITNHKEPSKRASAQSCNSNFGSEGGRMAIALSQSSDPAEWKAWMEWLAKKGRDDLLSAAQAAGRMTTGSRWPRAESPVPTINRPITSIADRIVGDAA